MTTAYGVINFYSKTLKPGKKGESYPALGEGFTRNNPFLQEIVP